MKLTAFSAGNPLHRYTPSKNCAPEAGGSITLRPLELRHAAFILTLMDRAACDNLAIEPITTLEQGEGFVSGHHSSQPHRYGIWCPQYGLVGAVAWGRLSGGRGIISYWIAKRYRQRGLAKQAVRQLIKIMQSQGITDIYADVYRDNQASRGLLNAVGFSWWRNVESDANSP